MSDEGENFGSATFESTHWTAVRRATGGSSTDARAALEQLCRSYWLPIYAYVRRRGYAPEDAEDLTQEFFAMLIARQDLARAEPGKGRFRSFLLGCLHRFLTKDWRKRQTIKRGGQQRMVPLEVAQIEERLCVDLATAVSPERLYDQRWAVAVLDQAMDQLRGECAENGKEDIFRELKKFLTEAPDDSAYDALALRLGTTSNALSTSVHRMRKRYREIVRQTLAQTVTTPLELEEEMRHLRDALT